ncbi:vascular endothelial growth factor receptor 1 isoform X2 [Danaus plexippus]|uniref:vascular endothelial growth factor receptor 1 isoform X2 n=1 Tax=Danaus plexippus TaxID=13037 RepID=UPI002AB0B7D9|nr:vascular endothelial growth factor receptor 1 isoform X2 [Danaus plexippus]
MSCIWSWRLLTVLGTIITCSYTLAFSNSIETDFKEIEGPVIIPSKSEIILKKGQNFTIYCKSNNPVQIKQQEIPEEIIESFIMIERNVTSSDDQYEFETALDLYNVDQFAVGYYACFDNTVNVKDILSNLMHEPVNNKHVTYLYVYVDETNSLFAPMREVVMSRSGSMVVIECRPTTPDINVTLVGLQSNKTPEILSYSPKIGFLVKISSYKCIGQRGNLTSWKFLGVNTIYTKNAEAPKPTIQSDSIYFLEGETFSLNCTVTSQPPLMLQWTFPRLKSKGLILNDTNEQNVTDGILYYHITIVNATEEDEGNYTCISKNSNSKQLTTTKKVYKGKQGFIILTKGKSRDGPLETKQGSIKLQYQIEDYPPCTYYVMKNNDKLPVESEKYKLSRQKGSIILHIKNLNISDTANYTLVASNKDVTKNVTYDIRKKAAPIVDFGPESDKRYELHQMATLKCEAIGYPLPTVEWIFSDKRGEEQTIQATQNIAESLIKVTSYLTFNVRTSGNITCHAFNGMNTTDSTRRFLVYEIAGGFGIKNSDDTWFPERQQVVLRCYASKYDFVNVTWRRHDDEKITGHEIKVLESEFSYIAELIINSVRVEDAGTYTCVGYKENMEENQMINLTVAETQLPVVTQPNKKTELEVNPYQPIRISCQASAVPPPQITWFKDGEYLLNNSNVEIFTENLNQTTVNSSIDIKQMLEDYKGKYECVAESGGQIRSGIYNVVLKDKYTYRSAIYLSIIAVVVFLLVLLMTYLIWKRREEQQFKRELAKAGLLNFNEGVTRSLNPELGIDEQAELLPYNQRFEFPSEKLILGKQLGAGAFGVVYKAEARGIVNAEETTPVAVKMVKKTADNMYIKALASELKIMVHLGKHINIVNLLGACTKNVGKRELIVIVEYCKFGNIHNYMQRHREVFIDQLTENKERNLGKVNRAFSSSTASSGMHSDYFSSNHSQNTDHTFINTANTNRSARKDNANQQVEFVGVSETGYVQPEWRSNYEGDYNYDGRSPRPLTSRDLLAWAFQIARGMEYLASRKVLHGDLAARNVLLAEDNIVKICDFGLARSIYKNDEYKKQADGPLPVKWLAIECMIDRIFSTQSDVWSFGIVLWELFSLAKTPYPNISPAHLIEWLNSGNRLDKPQYADDRLYDVMLRCWEQKPTARPNFSQLQEILGSFLEDNVRNHYVDLNSAYMDLNVKTEGQEDYLAMVCAPDYNNMVTPSPHHYVNDARSFFPPTPTQLQHDDEGYLQMSPANRSIFSPREPTTKFDFDARKLNPRVSEPNSQGSELTQLLTLNNLPARGGSESDHDGNTSPYLNMCPRIDEETDDVFETKQYNFKNAHNNQNTAVSNPTYIKFDVELEKKPQNNSNNYINVNVPNGLVK